MFGKTTTVCVCVYFYGYRNVTECVCLCVCCFYDENQLPRAFSSPHIFIFYEFGLDIKWRKFSIRLFFSARTCVLSLSTWGHSCLEFYCLFFRSFVYTLCHPYDCSNNKIHEKCEIFLVVFMCTALAISIYKKKLSSFSCVLYGLFNNLRKN